MRAKWSVQYLSMEVINGASVKQRVNVVQAHMWQGNGLLLWHLASLARCTAGNLLHRPVVFWVDQVATLQANWRVSTPPVASALLITASNRNPSCVRSHEKVSSWSMWPRDQQVHRKRLSDCTSWNTSSCWARQEFPAVVANTEVSALSLREPGTWPYWKATHAFALFI